MKTKHLAIAGLALAALVACNKEKAVETPLQDGDAYINVKINYSDPASRGTAAEPPFYYGTAAEQKINNAYFVFYHADGSYDQYVKKEDKDLTFTSNGTDASTDNNVEELSDAVVVLRNLKIDNYPAFMSVILNSNDDWIKTNISGKSISDAAEAVQTAIATVGTDAQVDWTNFMMSSSSFNNGDESTGYYCTKLTTANFQETEEKAQEAGNPVEAYVERLAAKVKVDFGESLNKEKGKIGSFVVDGQNKDLYYKVVGWGLDATTKDSYCFKNIDADWTKDGLGFEWNDPQNFRSYWAKSTNYGTGYYPTTYNSSDNPYYGKDGVTLNYIPYSGLKVQLGGHAYCRENTNNVQTIKNLPSTATTVLLGARITDEKGDAITLYNYKVALYAELDSYKAAALNDYEAKNPDKIIWKKTMENNETKYTQVGTADLDTVATADGFAHLELKDAENYYYGAKATINDNSTAVTTEEANKLLNGTEPHKYDTECNFYRNGMMYYHIPIEHLRESDKTAAEYTMKDGDYGVVRNHYYIITINSIKNLGKSVHDPDEEIVPNEDDSKNYYVAAKINVLSWKVVNQTVDL